MLAAFSAVCTTDAAYDAAAAVPARYLLFHEVSYPIPPSGSCSLSCALAHFQRRFPVFASVRMMRRTVFAACQALILFLFCPAFQCHCHCNIPLVVFPCTLYLSRMSTRKRAASIPFVPCAESLHRAFIATHGFPHARPFCAYPFSMHVIHSFPVIFLLITAWLAVLQIHTTSRILRCTLFQSRSANIQDCLVQ